MFFDKLDRIKMYEELKIYTESINLFLKEYHEKKLSEGKYAVGDAGLNVFALVQKYETKPKEKLFLESHIKYKDVQVIVKGRELIYCRDVNNLEVVEDNSDQRDILFYQWKDDCLVHKLTENMFGYYEPGDAHMPCVRWDDGDGEYVEKIVFKIPVEN